MKTLFRMLWLGFVYLFGLCGLVLAAVPEEITGLVTDATTVFGTVKTLVLSIVTFFVLLWVVKKVRAR